MDPAARWAILRRARHYLDCERPERALETLEEGADGLLEEVEYWRIRAGAEAGLERWSGCADVARRGLAVAADDVALLRCLAWAQVGLGDLHQAEQAALRAIELAPDSASTIALYAEVTARAGQFDKARRLLARAEELDPEEPDLRSARYNLAVFSGRHDEALRRAEEALEADPEDAELLRASSVILERKGRPIAARDRAQKAAAIDLKVVDGHEEEFLERKLRAHWLLLPLALISRFGPLTLWGAFIGLFILLQVVGLSAAAGWLALVYVVFCVYSWVVPPLLRRFVRR